MFQGAENADFASGGLEDGIVMVVGRRDHRAQRDRCQQQDTEKPEQGLAWSHGVRFGHKVVVIVYHVRWTVHCAPAP